MMSARETREKERERDSDNSSDRDSNNNSERDNNNSNNKWTAPEDVIKHKSDACKVLD